MTFRRRDVSEEAREACYFYGLENEGLVAVQNNRRLQSFTTLSFSSPGPPPVVLQPITKDEEILSCSWITKSVRVEDTGTSPWQPSGALFRNWGLGWERVIIDTLEKRRGKGFINFMSGTINSTSRDLMLVST
ncbi:hypothetical protein DPEC_G00250520 [Dallia pectoralis]|uniref:Uncharacterized protein n=1 Tax=Dallia pectoralis TaxID=75939 RepID=A0ACC2FSY6_DALPE|nr:hypothetical protein DPEC_G00250520 [Dallia pectoralis]